MLLLARILHPAREQRAGESGSQHRLPLVAQIGVRTPRADRKRHAMYSKRRGGRFVQTMEHGAGSPGAARGRVLLRKLIVKNCPQITVNGPVSAKAQSSTTRRLLFLQTADAARPCPCAARRTHAGKHCPSRARGDKNSTPGVRRLKRPACRVGQGLAP
jgi:hypothetical protein